MKTQTHISGHSAETGELKPISYDEYNKIRLGRMTPDKRAIEQARLDGLSPDKRAEEINKWDSLTPDEQAYRASEHLSLRWIGPGYVLAGQVLSNHPSQEDVWKSQGLTPEEIEVKRNELATSRASNIQEGAEQREKDNADLTKKAVKAQKDADKK